MCKLSLVIKDRNVPISLFLEKARPFVQTEKRVEFRGEVKLCKEMKFPFLYRNLRRLPDLKERDWQVLQADPKSSGNQCGPHHHRRLHVTLLLKPGAAQTGADGGHVHRQEGGGAWPGARPEPHLGGRSSHLHGLTGICREKNPERWEIWLPCSR